MELAAFSTQATGAYRCASTVPLWCRPSLAASDAHTPCGDHRWSPCGPSKYTVGHNTGMEPDPSGTLTLVPHPRRPRHFGQLTPYHPLPPPSSPPSRTQGAPAPSTLPLGASETAGKMQGTLSPSGVVVQSKQHPECPGRVATTKVAHSAGFPPRRVRHLGGTSRDGRLHDSTLLAYDSREGDERWSTLEKAKTTRVQQEPVIQPTNGKRQTPNTRKIAARQAMYVQELSVRTQRKESCH